MPQSGTRSPEGRPSGRPQAPTDTSVDARCRGRDDLGIETGGAVFSLVDTVALHGVPFKGGYGIVAVIEHDMRAAETLGGGLTSAPTFLDWRRGWVRISTRSSGVSPIQRHSRSRS